VTGRSDVKLLVYTMDAILVDGSVIWHSADVNDVYILSLLQPDMFFVSVDCSGRISIFVFLFSDCVIFLPFEILVKKPCGISDNLYVFLNLVHVLKKAVGNF